MGIKEGVLVLNLALFRTEKRFSPQNWEHGRLEANKIYYKGKLHMSLLKATKKTYSISFPLLIHPSSVPREEHHPLTINLSIHQAFAVVNLYQNYGVFGRARSRPIRSNAQYVFERFDHGAEEDLLSYGESNTAFCT